MYSPDDLVKRLQALANKLETHSVSRTTWLQHTQINEHHITKHFASWNHFIAEAGLEPLGFSRIPDDELFEQMHDYFIAAGEITTRTRFNREAPLSADVYRKRWGRWGSILSAFGDWVRVNHPAFPYIDQLDAMRSDREPRKPVAVSEAGTIHSRSWPSVQRRRLGPFLNFRGLQHEPVNEDGVIFLFGMVAHELGFVVEHIAAEFPDCEAKRRVAPDRWERVRIEFEFDSRNFLAHGHQLDDADMIICWIHNWLDCPIEVLELRDELSRLPS